MLQNCYKLHTFVTIDRNVKSGRFSTSSDNVQDGKKSTRKYIVKSGARNDIQGPRGRGRAGVQSPVPGYIRAGASWKLEAAITSWAP